MDNIDNSSPVRCAVLTHHLFRDGEPQKDLIDRLYSDPLMVEFHCFSHGYPSVDLARAQYTFPHAPDSSMGYLSQPDLLLLLDKEHSFRLQKEAARGMIELANQVGKVPWQEIEKKLLALNPTMGDKPRVPTVSAKEVYESRKGIARGPLTGIKPIDDVIEGLEFGTLTTNFAFVSHYKTLTLTNIVYSAAKLGYNSCFNTLEVPREFVKFALLARHSYDSRWVGKGSPVNTRDIRKGTLTPEQEEFLFGLVEPDFDSLPGKVVILEAGELSDYTAKEFDRWCQASGIDIDLYALDYIQLLMGGRDPYDTGNFYVDEAKSIALGRTSNRKRVSLMAAQANRDGYARAVENDGKYDLRAVAELNRIERSSDNIFSTYVDENLRAARECLLQLHKHRGGELIETPTNIKVDPRYSCIGSSEDVEPVKVSDVGLLSGIPGMDSSVGF